MPPWQLLSCSVNSDQAPMLEAQVLPSGDWAPYYDELGWEQRQQRGPRFGQVNMETMDAGR